MNGTNGTTLEETLAELAIEIEHSQAIASGEHLCNPNTCSYSSGKEGAKYER